MTETVTTEKSFPPKSGDVFDDFVLEECLKKSKDCVVFVCHRITDGSLKFVAKIAINREASKLANELKYYKHLSGGEGIPQLIYYKSWIETKEEWVERDWTMIVIQKLHQIFAKTTSRYTTFKLSLEELVPMAIQQISLLEFIHSRGLIHKGIKPDNFVVSEDKSKVFLIDFNKSKQYRLSDGSHIQFDRDNKRPKGLPLFHSLNYHNGIRSSRRDDVESLGLCWVYLLKGSLPWSKFKHEGKYWPQYVRNIGQCVNETSIKDLCADLPRNSSQYFERYFEMCRKLDFSEEPNYNELRQLIASSLTDPNNNQ